METSIKICRSGVVEAVEDVAVLDTAQDFPCHSGKFCCSYWPKWNITRLSRKCNKCFRLKVSDGESVTI